MVKWIIEFLLHRLMENVDSLKEETNKDNILYGTMDSWLAWVILSKTFF